MMVVVAAGFGAVWWAATVTSNQTQLAAHLTGTEARLKEESSKMEVRLKQDICKVEAGVESLRKEVKSLQQDMQLVLAAVTPVQSPQKGAGAVWRPR